MIVQWYNNKNRVRVDTIQYAQRIAEVLVERLMSVTGSIQI